jgi:hypothetical protein
MTDDLSLGETIAVLVTVGVFTALGKLLASNEKLTWRLVFGRAIVSAALSLAAGAMLAFIPGLSTLALVGLACASAVLGEQFLEKWLSSKTGAP